MPNSVMTIFNSIFPVFFIILLGFYLSKRKLINIEVQKGLNALAYWVGLPAFLVYKITNADIDFSSSNKVLISMIGGMFITSVIAFAVAFLMKMPKAARGGSVQAAFRGNLAFVALPIAIYSMELITPERADSIINQLILGMTTIIIFYNFVSVSVLISHSEVKRDNIYKSVFKELLTNPLMIACVLGLCLNLMGIQFSKGSASFRILETLGYSAFPMALLGIGSQLSRISIKGHISWAISSCIIKIVICPIISYFICHILGMDSATTCGVLILQASPTAVACYVLADQLECGAELTASTIAISTCLSFFTFSIILMSLS